MQTLSVSQQEAAKELLRRRRARADLAAYVNAIDVPGRPVSEDEDEWLFHPIESSVAAHHYLMLGMLQDIAEGKTKQGMIFMPPGSAKSTYASVVFPTWFMGRNPGSRIILASYASDIARKQGRRARSIVRSQKFSSIFGTEISSDTSAADEWALTNESEFMAGGILSGITGNRAHGLIVDDPVKGREDADSDVIRKKTKEAYEDDLTTRLIPGGWTLIIQTRWNHDDLAGSILPVGWAGESGDIHCRDGLVWRVLCLPAIAESPSDPLGRAIGEPLWPEWFSTAHFERYKRNVRTWSALYQQRPTPDSGDYFRAEWLHEYDHLPAKDTLTIYGASDYAVTQDGGDYTVHILVGIDPNGKLWLLDVWREQSSSDVWVEKWCDLVVLWRPAQWAEETGQINSGVGPFLVKEARKRKANTWRVPFTSRHDKAVRARSIQGRMAMDGLMVPRNAPWLSAFKNELLSFPAGQHDDQVDALGLIGQLLDRMVDGDAEKEPKKPPEHALIGQPDGSMKSTLTIAQLIERQKARRSNKGSVRV